MLTLEKRVLNKNDEFGKLRGGNEVRAYASISTLRLMFFFFFLNSSNDCVKHSSSRCSNQPLARCCKLFRKIIQNEGKENPTQCHVVSGSVTIQTTEEENVKKS